MIKYRVILSKKNAITIFIRYFENDTILGITIYHQTICSSLVLLPCSAPLFLPSVSQVRHSLASGTVTSLGSVICVDYIAKKYTVKYLSTEAL